MISQVQSINITCDVSRQEVEIVTGPKEWVLACTVTQISKVLNRGEIIESCQTTNGSACDEVIAFGVENFQIFYFPQGLDKIFKNLQLIAIMNCQLKEIKSEDLRPFSNLLVINLEYNEIQSLESNLFANNQKLQSIFLNNNQIMTIHPFAFDGLNNLIKVNLTENPCLNGSSALASDNDLRVLQNELIILANYCNAKRPQIITEKPGNQLDNELSKCERNTQTQNEEISELKRKNNDLRMELMRLTNHYDNCLYKKNETQSPTVTSLTTKAIQEENEVEAISEINKINFILLIIFLLFVSLLICLKTISMCKCQAKKDDLNSAATVTSISNNKGFDNFAYGQSIEHVYEDPLEGHFGNK